MTWLFTGLGLLMIVGVINISDNRNKTYVLYCIMQVLLPIIGIFGLLIGLIGIRMPAYESRQFVIILPSTFVLVSLGIARINQYASRRLTIPLIVSWLMMLYLSGSIIVDYWNSHKFYAHIAIDALTEQLRDGDAVVSLHYRPSALMSFYLPHLQPYTNPQKIDDKYLFARTNIILPLPHLNFTPTYSVQDIHHNRRIWLVYKEIKPELKEALLKGCSVPSEQTLAGYVLMLLENCQ